LNWLRPTRPRHGVAMVALSFVSTAPSAVRLEGPHGLSAQCARAYVIQAHGLRGLVGGAGAASSGPCYARTDGVNNQPAAAIY